MQTLYPIVRRVRRPLIVAESVPDGPPKPLVVVGNVEPVQAVAATPTHPSPHPADATLSHPMGEGNLPVGEGTAGDASRIVGEPSGESGPVIVDGKKSDEKVSSKRKAR